jgi:hypothetical protein
VVRDRVNPNERTLLALENVGNEAAWGSVPGGFPITAAQELTCARQIAYYHVRNGVPINRETVVGHYQLNSVSRPNCPSYNKSVIDRIVAQAQKLTAPEDDMAYQTRPVREQWDIPDGMAFYVAGPGIGDPKFFVGAVRLWSNGETLDGKWRRLEYEDTPGAGEELWADGAKATRKMKPVPGSRNPVSGFGTPTLSTGFTQTDLVAAKAAGTTAGFGNAKAQAIVAAENNLATVRGMS